MTQFNLFDTVKLKEEIRLGNGEIAPINTTGVIIESYNNGEAYEVELFGKWVKYDRENNLIETDKSDPNSFLETIGVETIYPDQLIFIKPASETVGVRAQLLSLLDQFSEESILEVKQFAEFIQYKNTKSFC